ncbi:hypothetical protein GMMP15_100033 [Candidatus Magnetomoraceae bacterium gMMP-15]
MEKVRPDPIQRISFKKIKITRILGITIPFKKIFYEHTERKQKT